MGSTPRELSVAPPDRGSPPVIGRIAGKGLSYELTDHGYLVVDGVDGRAHYVTAQPMGNSRANYFADAVRHGSGHPAGIG